MTNAKESYEAKILDKLIGNSERLAVIELTVTQIKGEVEALDNKVEALDNKVEDLDNKVEDLDNKVETLESEVSKLSTGQTEITSRLSKVEGKIERISSNQNVFFTILIGIGTGILATLYSQPILNALSHLRYSNRS